MVRFLGGTVFTLSGLRALLHFALFAFLGHRSLSAGTSYLSAPLCEAVCHLGSLLTDGRLIKHSNLRGVDDLWVKRMIHLLVVP